jgi:septal ring factor EnvC (AmiA/AmiB activator)
MSINLQRWHAYEGRLRKENKKLPGLPDGSVNLSELEAQSGIRRQVFYAGPNGNKQVIAAFNKTLLEIGTDTQTNPAITAEERSSKLADNKSKEASRLHKQLDQKVQEIEQLRQQISELQAEVSRLKAEKLESHESLREMENDGRRYFL